MDWLWIIGLATAGLTLAAFGTSHVRRSFEGSWTPAASLAHKPTLWGLLSELGAPSARISSRAIVTGSRAGVLIGDDVARAHLGVFLATPVLAILGVIAGYPILGVVSATAIVIGTALRSRVRREVSRVAVGWGSTVLGLVLFASAATQLSSAGFRFHGWLTHEGLRWTTCVAAGAAIAFAWRSQAMCGAFIALLVATRLVDTLGGGFALLGAIASSPLFTRRCTERSEGDRAALASHITSSSISAGALGLALTWGALVGRDLVEAGTVLSFLALAAFAAGTLALATHLAPQSRRIVEGMLKDDDPAQCVAGLRTELEEIPQLAEARLRAQLVGLGMAARNLAHEVFMGSAPSEIRTRTELDSARGLATSLTAALSDLGMLRLTLDTFGRLEAYRRAALARLEVAERIAQLRVLGVPSHALGVPRAETLQFLELSATSVVRLPELDMAVAGLNHQLAESTRQLQMLWNMEELTTEQAQLAQTWLASIPLVVTAAYNAAAEVAAVSPEPSHQPPAQPTPASQPGAQGIDPPAPLPANAPEAAHAGVEEAADAVRSHEGPLLG